VRSAHGRADSYRLKDRELARPTLGQDSD
jgi:hypothetical protein